MIGYFEGFFRYSIVWWIWRNLLNKICPYLRYKTMKYYNKKKQALKLFHQDWKYIENFVNNKNYVPQTLNQAQFDILFSFEFNLGSYTLQELCKKK